MEKGKKVGNRDKRINEKWITIPEKEWLRW